MLSGGLGGVRLDSQDRVDFYFGFFRVGLGSGCITRLQVEIGFPCSRMPVGCRSDNSGVRVD